MLEATGYQRGKHEHHISQLQRLVAPFQPQARNTYVEYENKITYSGLIKPEFQYKNMEMFTGSVINYQ